MREIIVSIKPKYSALIFSGAKTVELRKKVGVLFEPGKRIYIYSSSPVKMLSGEATIDNILVDTPSALSSIALDKGCVSGEYFDDYFMNCAQAVAIRLRDVVEYENKVPLAGLRLAGITPPQSYCYIEKDIILELLRGSY